MEEVILPRPIVNRILHQAQASPEEEVCGLIAARNGRPSDCYRVSNISQRPERLFAMDPQQQIAALRKIRQQGKELYGIYHSHPHSPAVPSAADLEQAGYPEALYLIVSLNTRGVLEMRGYRLMDSGAEEVQLEI